MSCISPTRRAAIQTAIDRKLAQLVILYSTYDTALASDAESYTFDSGEARQTTKLRKLSEIQEQIDLLEGQISRLQRRLDGRGVVNFNMRRKSAINGIRGC